MQRLSIMRWFVLLLLLSASACGSSGEVGKDFEPFDAGNFEDSAKITNQWMPLTPGMQLVFEGETVEEGTSVPHRVVITVTDLTKVIDGVKSAVTYDLDYSDGEMVEKELAFFAQDTDGAVWRMGEYPEEYENGEFTIAPAWIHGIEDASAGIAMLADPDTDTPDYSQGWGPAVDWTDRGKVDQTSQSVCVPVDCYENVLVIAETSRSEAGAFQLKFFAPGVGNIKVDWRGDDQTQEILELTEFNQLSGAALDDVRAEALAMEKHAYEVSSDVYGQTSPLELPDGSSANIPPTAGPEGAAPLSSGEIVVYASDLPRSALFELDFLEDPASPGGKFIGLPNNGDELDPPPENDPHVNFKVSVQAGIPYRCWIHMKVGAPKGKSQANVVWVQLSDAVDAAGQEILQPGSDSYLIAQGPTQEGWVWVGCGINGPEFLVTFQSNGEVIARIQAGMEGVGFDQFVLSAGEFLDAVPGESVISK